jgi:hypothetical protein
VPPDSQARATSTLLRSRGEEPGASTLRSRAEEPGTSTRAQRSDSPDEVRGGKRETAELYVVVYPFGDVWVDDKPAGQAPVALHLSPGSHEIAVGEGRVQERQTVRLRPGESKHLTFRSKPEP